MQTFDPVTALFERAETHRIPMSRICEKAEVDPTTPSRWKRGVNGANLSHVMKLHKALDDILATPSTPKDTVEKAA